MIVGSENPSLRTGHNKPRKSRLISKQEISHGPDCQYDAAVGHEAPDFSLPDAGGKKVSLSDFADAPAVLVIFMCNHCPYVKHVAAGLAELAKDYQRRGVAVVGINANDVETTRTIRPPRWPRK